MMRRIGIAASVLLLVAAIAGWWFFYRPTRFAVDIGSGMLAKQICSCLFVAGRDFEACRADQFASMDRIQVEVQREPPRVRAFVPLFGERSAVHREGLGCTLE